MYSVKMSELDDIKAKIASTEGMLASAETDSNDTRKVLYEKLLAAQQGEENILLARAGNLLSHRNAVSMLSHDSQY